MTSKSKPAQKVKKAFKNERKTSYHTAKVTALRNDGTVNLAYGGIRHMGVPTMASYDPRAVGDRVHILLSTGGHMIVLGKVGSDDRLEQPTIFPVDVRTYTWGRPGGDRYTPAGPGMGLFDVGRASENFPVGSYDTYRQGAFTYWDGTNNLMTGPATLEKNIDLYLERDEWEVAYDGYEGPSYFTLWPLKNNGLPHRPQELEFQDSLSVTRIDFTLEPGEVQVIQLPEVWRNNIGAAVVDSDTIKSFLVTPRAKSTYAGDAGARTYGYMTTLTGGLRIY